jgi:negative regulator of flagellin synthesis FlgM
MKVPGDNTVASKISGMDAKPVRAAQGVGAIRRHDQASGQQSATAAQGDNVSLTGTARDLASIQQSLMAMPAVDEARVANVKRRLDGGEYRVDAQRVADRLLSLEGDLARRSPLEHSQLK